MEEKKNPSSDIYKNRGLFFSLALTMALLLVNVAFSWKFRSDLDAARARSMDLIEEETLDVPVTEHPPPPQPVIRSPHVIEVPDEEEIKEEIKVDLDMEETSVVEPTPALHPVEEEESDEIMVIVESKPQFPGGEVEMMKFIQKHLDYPPQARRMGIEGKVYVSAVIERDGTISNVAIMKGIGAGCDDEAMRVIKSFPLWTPGKQRGKAVRVKAVFPITFRFHN